MTLCLSQGVPMLSGGDEVGRTQQGNNNAYCQDNEISWTNWARTDEDRALFEFTCRAVHLMHEHPVLRRRRFLQGRRIRGSDVRDIMWLTPGGQEAVSRWRCPVLGRPRRIAASSDAGGAPQCSRSPARTGSGPAAAIGPASPLSDES